MRMQTMNLTNGCSRSVAAANNPGIAKLSGTMITRTILTSGIRRIASGFVLGTMLMAMTSVAATMDFPASGDIFVRSLSPNTTHDADLISIRKFAGEQRYGIIQFDLSPLVGQMVTSAELILDELGSGNAGSDANYPLVSTAYIIGTSNDVPDVSSMTWNTYQATYEGQEGSCICHARGV